jgi:hypothetical protein
MRLTFDHLIFGYFAGDDLIYVKRIRNGFTSAVRRNCSRGASGSGRCAYQKRRKRCVD